MFRTYDIKQFIRIQIDFFPRFQNCIACKTIYGSESEKLKPNIEYSVTAVWYILYVFILLGNMHDQFINYIALRSMGSFVRYVHEKINFTRSLE